ncbi:MAG: sugar ABC transporter ATP-binding protein [Clostridiales Family XIII bacterium]|nr:sugar ABC transporter ATP-binding protein [Clostridiales Family XIII bacterium]
MSEYILEMNEITKIFPGVVALDKVDLKVRPGSVHALMGENGAGKSTLMKCLFGIYHEDGGEIILDGKPVKIESSKKALDLGISMIHQELHPIRFRPVTENIWLGRFPKRFIAVDHHKMERDTKALLEEVSLNISPTTPAGNLPAASMQLVEIAKAISYDSKIIIMDEPTSSLSDTEVEHLFRIINKLKSEGRSIIYISHKMEEILKISDEVTIMRDGKSVGTWSSAELTTELIINRMVGRDLENRFPPKEYKPKEEVVLKASGLTSAAARSFVDVSFELRRGEILGIGGLVGAQRTELVESIFGLRNVAFGTVEKDGRVISIKNVPAVKQSHIALLTEERRASGVFGILSVLDNVVIANQSNYAKAGVLNDRKRYRAAKEASAQLRVKTPSLETNMENLSGGNQQKVLIARWLLTNPDILILDEPTRGIDVGAKYEIYTIMHELISAGKSIIMISSEMPELLGMSDRIMVMCEGRVSGFLGDRSKFDQVEVMRLAAKFSA